MRRNLHLLTTPGFLLSLSLLLSNDFLFKPLFNNWLTGKLSDFAGLFALPFFLAAFAPRYKRAIYLSTAPAFAFWKSVYSEPLIDWWNSLQVFTVARVVDPTDLIAFLVMPLSYIYYGQQQQPPPACTERLALRRLATGGVIIISLFAFTATQRAGDHMVVDDREYEFAMSKGELLRDLQKIVPYVHHYRVDDVFVERANRMRKEPMTEEDRNNYSFRTNSKFCDDTVYASCTLHTRPDKTILKIGHLIYNCKVSDKQHDAEAVRTFERDIVERLGGKPVAGWPD